MPRNLITKICPICGTPFEVFPSQVSTHVYCSRECRETRVEQTCEQCGARYSVSFGMAKKRRFCSRSCKDKARDEQRATFVVCERCGRERWVKRKTSRLCRPCKASDPRPGARKTERYVVDRKTGCWNWMLFRDRDGYGRDGAVRAHRAAWERKNGPIPDGMDVHHVCHNPSCVNPEHLALLPPGDHMRLHKAGKPGHSRLNGRWSMAHDSCVSCNRTDSPHVGNGLCRRCFEKTPARREWRRRRYKAGSRSSSSSFPSRDDRI